MSSGPHGGVENPGNENGADTDWAIESKRRLSLREWIEEKFDWSWFTCTQSTGGVAVTLSLCPKQFAGLQTIGVIIFISNLVLFVTFVGLLLAKWILQPNGIRKSFTQAPQCYFYGSSWLTIATIIICMQRFGVPHNGPWLIVAIRVCFWIYAACTILSTTIHMVVMFEYHQVNAIDMNPAWLLLVFNAMLTGTIASTIAMDQPAYHRVPIIVAGVSYQGFGWITSMLILSWFFGHLMEKGWPAPSMAPGLFMTVGSAGFTMVALIGNARALPHGYDYFASHPTANETLLIVATWVSIFLWIFALWLFGIALFTCLAMLVKRNNIGKWSLPMKFNNTWWGFIFPNVGFTIGTIYLGQELGSNAILWVSAIMVIVLVAFWLFDLFLMAQTIVRSLVKPGVKLSPMRFRKIR